jgi:hypothetical protein
MSEHPMDDVRDPHIIILKTVIDQAETVTDILRVEMRAYTHLFQDTLAPQEHATQEEWRALADYGKQVRRQRWPSPPTDPDLQAQDGATTSTGEPT